MTDSIGQLVAALAKAQAKFETPRKDKVAKVRSEKGSYEYRYSDLADLIASVRGPLSENELVFTHCLVPAERGTIVCTILAHSSGEMLKSEYLLPHFQRQQEFGSALTYAKRYALSSLLGIAADDDDDGNIADSATPPRLARDMQKEVNREITPSLLPNPEEPPKVGERRAYIAGLIDDLETAVDTAKNSMQLDATWVAAQPNLNEIDSYGKAGKEAAYKLRSRYMARSDQLKDAEATAR